MAYVVVVLAVLVLCYVVIGVGPIDRLLKMYKNEARDPGTPQTVNIYFFMDGPRRSNTPRTIFPGYDLSRQDYRIHLMCCRTWCVFSIEEMQADGDRLTFSCSCGDRFTYRKAVLDRRCRWDVRREEHIPTSHQR